MRFIVFKNFANVSLFSRTQKFRSRLSHGIEMNALKLSAAHADAVVRRSK